MAQTSLGEKYEDLAGSIRNIQKIPGYKGYIVLTQDCIPIDKQQVTTEEAVCYAAVVSDLVHKTNIMLKTHSADGKEELRSIRIRTKKGIEIVITVNGNYTLVVLQDCTGVADVRPKDAKTDAEDFK